LYRTLKKVKKEKLPLGLRFLDWFPKLQFTRKLPLFLMGLLPFQKNKITKFGVQVKRKMKGPVFFCVRPIVKIYRPGGGNPSSISVKKKKKKKSLFFFSFANRFFFKEKKIL
jgi:hypothetical protein